MAERSVCTARLEEFGRCDLDAGHHPATSHLLINITGQQVWSKTIWPFDEQDPDVQQYLAVAQAYEDEDNRQIAARQAGRQEL